MSQTCPDPIHTSPLPRGYLAAAYEAEDRLAAGWQNRACPQCGEYGWVPPTVPWVPDEQGATS